MVRSADLTLIIILATTTMAISKITEPSEQKNWPDFLLPPSNVQYINGEFITSPDRGELVELTGVKAACVNTAQPEEEGAKVRKLGDTEAEDLPAKTRVFNDTTPFNGTEVEEEVFKKEEFKLC